MTAKHNPDEVARLIAEARADDERMTPAPWETGEDPGESAATLRARPCIRGRDPGDWVDVIVPFGRAYSDAAGIARTRNNLRAMADQLEAAQAEIDTLRAAIANLHDQVDQTDPNDPIGAALTRAGLARRPDATSRLADVIKQAVSDTLVSYAGPDATLAEVHVGGVVLGNAVAGRVLDALRAARDKGGDAT